MKKTLIMILCLLILLTGCSQSSVTLEEYSKKYSDLFMAFEKQFHEQLMFEAVDLIDARQFRVVYSHEDFIHFYDELIKTMDDILYELSLVGPDLDDQLLMKYQSKLEGNIFEMMTTMKQYRERSNFNTLAVNNFSFYDDIYNLMREITPEIIEMNDNQMIIENYLSEQGYGLDEAYHLQKYINLQGYCYFYSVLSSQIASYQDYSGLQVSPRFPISIANNDGDIYLTSELDFNVMLTTSDEVGQIMRIMSDIDMNTEIDVSDQLGINDFIGFYMRTYEQYADVRGNYSYNFFKSGEFKDYQVRVRGEDTIMGRDPGFPVYGFDESLEEERGFLGMQDAFYTLVLQIYDPNHAGYMSIEK